MPACRNSRSLRPLLARITRSSLFWPPRGLERPQPVRTRHKPSTAARTRLENAGNRWIAGECIAPRQAIGQARVYTARGRAERHGIATARVYPLCPAGVQRVAGGDGVAGPGEHVQPALVGEHV